MLIDWLIMRSVAVWPLPNLFHPADHRRHSSQGKQEQLYQQTVNAAQQMAGQSAIQRAQYTLEAVVQYVNKYKHSTFVAYLCSGIRLVRQHRWVGNCYN